MLASCQEGHVEVAKILSSHGADRQHTATGCELTGSGSGAERLARCNGFDDLLAWLQHVVLVHDVLEGVQPLQPPRRAPNAPPPPHQAHRIGSKVALAFGATPTLDLA